MTAEDITVSLAVAPGWTVAGATGAGYQSVKRDAQANADIATWSCQSGRPTSDIHDYVSVPAGPGLAKGTLVWSKPALPSGVPDNVAVALTPPPPAPAR